MINFHNTVFSKEQITAINHYYGPALVIAGPGSGKTAVIVNRIQYLIQKHQVNPKSILVITFSKMAAMNMQSRYYSLNQNHISNVHFGTFHSVFLELVKDYYHLNSDCIITNEEKRRYVKKCLKIMALNNNIEDEYIDILLKRIAYYKNSNLTLDADDDFTLSKQEFLRFFDTYSNLLKSVNKIDFEDIILLCNELLENNSYVKKLVWEQYKYILIDEFQDINKLQFDVVRKMLGPNNNLFAVGDDDQAIYGFRGSCPEFMINFKKYFPDAMIIKLSCNYRSTKNIVHSASLVINENKIRFEKLIFSNNELGSPVDIRKFDSINDETNSITDYLKNYLSNPVGNVAILFRTNNRAELFYEILKVNNIPCVIRERITSPYTHFVFVDFMHYMNMAMSVDKPNIYDLIAVINKPVRFVPINIIGKDDDLKSLIDTKEKTGYEHVFAKLYTDLQRIADMDMYCAFNYFLKVIGYEKYIYSGKCITSKDLNAVFEVIEELKIRLKMFTSYEQLQIHINNLSHIDYSQQKLQIKEKGIYLLTYHASKGLEFDNCIIPCLNEGIVPSKNSIDEKDIEEERRMLYVAMTRAKKNLLLSYIEDKDNKYMSSRFIKRLL